MKISRVLLLVVALMPVACLKEQPAQDGARSVKVCISESVTQTKTWLDSGSSEDVIPVYWSDGDRINVNGQVSDPLSVPEGMRMSSASFAIRNVEAPYNVVYPSSICPRQKAEGSTVRVSFPAVQEYSPTSFGNGAGILYGWSGSAADDVEMKNLCGAVKLGLTDNLGAAVKSVSISSNDPSRPVSGTFDLDVMTGNLTYITDGSGISLDIPVISLSPSSQQDFFFTVPAGDYPKGFCISITQEDGRTMTCNWIRPGKGAPEGISVVPGRLVRFDNIEFSPGAKEISTEDDWNSFAAAVNSGDGEALDTWLEKGVAKVAADISFSGTPVSISEYSYTLDGQGHVFTMNTSASLFGSLSGTVASLVTAGNFTGNGAPLVDILDGGVVDGCTNRMSVSFKGDADAHCAGFVNTARKGRITGCVNDATLVEANIETSSQRACQLGGIVANVKDMTGAVEVRECVNNAAIRFMFNRADRFDTPFNGIGGIVGRLTGSPDSGKALLIEDCVNNGRVSRDELFYGSTVYHSGGVGGIIGLAGEFDSSSYCSDPATSAEYRITISGCMNTAEISDNAALGPDSKKLLARSGLGGIAGIIFGSASERNTIEGCVNTGNLIPHTGTYSRSAFGLASGGIAGLSGNINITGCSVNATIGTVKKHNAAVAGVIGIAIAPFSISECDVCAQLEFIQSSTFTVGDFALGITANSTLYADAFDISGSSITSCRFCGSVNTATAAYSSVPKTFVKTVWTADNFGDYIIGSSYTGDGVTVSGNSFLDTNGTTAL